MELLKNEIVDGIRQAGYDSDLITVNKNGVLKEGIKICEAGEKAAVIIYFDALEKECSSTEDIVETVIAMYEENRNIGFDIAQLKNPDYILSGIFIGLQRKSDMDIIKSDIDFSDEIESFLYIRGTIKNGRESAVIKVTKEILKLAGVDLKEAWKAAENNTYRESELMPMSKILLEMDEDEKVSELFPPMYVLSNKTGVNGAAAILNTELLKSICIKHNVKEVYAIPSSVHEFILLPKYENDSNSLDELSEMVKQANHDVVLPEEQLSDRAYVIAI